MCFAITTAEAVEEPPSTDLKADVAETVDTASTVVDDTVDGTADAGNVSVKEETENTISLSSVTVEKTAAVQTASWGEIKRKFKDR